MITANCICNLYGHSESATRPTHFLALRQSQGASSSSRVRCAKFDDTRVLFELTCRQRGRQIRLGHYSAIPCFHFVDVSK